MRWEVLQMKKRTIQMIFLVTIVALLSGCGLKERLKETIGDTGNNKEEESYTIDRERYEEYAEVLEDIIDDNEWPDGRHIKDDAYPYFGRDSFAICDIDMDGAEELIVEISDTSMAGMMIRVFDYDPKSDEVVEEYTGFPGVEFFDNGILYQPASHNQGGAEIHPFDVYRYNAEQDAYEMVTSIDTQASFDEWKQKEMGKAKSIYIPYEEIWEQNVERVERLAKIEGAIKPNRIVTKQKITQYDINANEKRDRIEVRMDEKDEYLEEPDYGTKWSVLINDKVVFSISQGEGVRLEVEFYKVNSRRTYLSIKQEGYYNGFVFDMDLYQFRDGEMVEHLDCYKTITDNSEGYYPNASVAYLTVDKLQIEASEQLQATAGIAWQMNYEYQKQDGKWTLSSEEFPIVERFYENDSKNRWTAHTEFEVYKSWDGKEEGFTVHRGEVIYLEAIRHYNGETYFKARNMQGQEGWFVDPKEGYREENGEWLQGYFEETMFAG